MACDSFVTGSPWNIKSTSGDEVSPFVVGNDVVVSPERNGNFTVQVFQGTQLQGTYTGYTCAGEQLDGKVGNDELLMALSGGGTGRLVITGEWNPTAQTAGTWVGDEGGGGGSRDEA